MVASFYSGAQALATWVMLVGGVVFVFALTSAAFWWAFDQVTKGTEFTKTFLKVYMEMRRQGKA